VSRRARHLSLYLAALAAGVVVAFAVSASAQGDAAQPPPTAAVTAVDYDWEADNGGTTAAVAAGGTVTFSYPTGMSLHNVEFTQSQPATCTQTAGSDTGAVPPLPAQPSGPGWAGTCRFDAAGSYAFVCGLHAYMTGTVHVGDGSGTPPVGPPGYPAPPPTPTPPGSDSPGQSKPLKVTVARRQRGTTVRGSVTTSENGSRIAVKALVSNRLLAKSPPRRIRKVSVGSLRKQVAAAGKTSFALKLNATARRALKRIERLSVELRIKVTPPGGPTATKTARVTLRPST
jgi:plastocyanin